MAKQLDNGEYTVEVALTGGSGKATVQSPTKLTVEDGKMTAEIRWSSSHYDYMEVDGKEYRPVNTEGNSLFVIDVSGLDSDIPVKAETLAMSTPHMIDYTLRFDSATVRKTGDGLTTMIVTCALGAAILAGAAAAVFRKRRKA